MLANRESLPNKSGRQTLGQNSVLEHAAGQANGVETLVLNHPACDLDRCGHQRVVKQSGTLFRRTAGVAQRLDRKSVV